jgi:hypothetical protein
MCKNKTILEEIVLPVLTDMFPTQTSRKLALKHPNAYNVEHLVELAMSSLGDYKFIDGEHEDFTDGTDCKTASISRNPAKPGQNSYRLEISNIVGASGNEKSGDLRVVLYNPHKEGKDRLEYYYVPKSVWIENVNRHPTTGVGRMFATYNIQKDYIPKLQECRVDTFEELSRRSV